MKAIKTDQAPIAKGILSQAIESDGFVFTSGQIHLTADGQLVKGSVEDKTQQIMSNLQAILKAAGLGFKHVIKATVYMTDMSEYAEFNKTYVTYFSDPFPAREVVCVKELPLGASMEVSLVAKK